MQQLDMNLVAGFRRTASFRTACVEQHELDLHSDIGLAITQL
jgi:hypothetical protein